MIITVNRSLDALEKATGIKLSGATEAIDHKKIEKTEKINLSHKDLPNIPSEIARFAQLIGLDCKNNFLTEFPKEIHDLTNLKQLDLGSNLIEKIPEWIGGLNALEKLCIDNNPVDSLPSRIGCLRRLIFFSAGSASAPNMNKLPQSFANLQNLKYCYLSNCGFTEIPTQLFHLKKLSFLDLSYNKIKEIPNVIKLLKRLQYIDVSHNQIESVSPVICQLPILNDFSCTDNFPQNPISKTFVAWTADGVERRCLEQLGIFFDFPRFDQVRQFNARSPLALLYKILIRSQWLHEQRRMKILFFLGELEVKDRDCFYRIIGRAMQCPPGVDAAQWGKNRLWKSHLGLLASATQQTIVHKYLCLDKSIQQAIGVSSKQTSFVHRNPCLLADAICLKKRDFFKETRFNPLLYLTKEFKQFLKEFKRIKLLDAIVSIDNCVKIKNNLREEEYIAKPLEMLCSTLQHGIPFQGHAVFQKIEPDGTPFFIWKRNISNLRKSENNLFYLEKAVENNEIKKIEDSFENEEAMRNGFSFFKKIVPRGFKQDGCHSRSIWTALMLFELFKVKSKTIIATGNEEKLIMAESFPVEVRNCKWRFHAAALVECNSMEFVFDLIFDKPVAVSEWKGYFSNKVVIFYKNTPSVDEYTYYETVKQISSLYLFENIANNDFSKAKIKINRKPLWSDW